MMCKRNQVEDALARVLQPRAIKLSSEIRGRLKRLLELDRARGRNQTSTDPAKPHFAFYGADGSGSGIDNKFESYEAFAILLGLHLLGHGLPQRSVVDLLRRLRPQLQRHHERILTQGPPSIRSDDTSIAAKVGEIAVDAVDPVFLVVYSDRAGSGSTSGAVCRGQRAVFELFHRCGPGHTFTLIELVSCAHSLNAALARTKPKSRGRTRRH